MAERAGATRYRWEEMPRERVTDLLERRLITGDRMMLAHVYLKKGCIVPRHSHENEQLTYILEGALRFWIGEDGAEEVVVRAGEVLHLPSGVPHQAEALEDTLDVETRPMRIYVKGNESARALKGGAARAPRSAPPPQEAPWSWG
jgi:quercetin dioxygenase-like cupin family protein